MLWWINCKDMVYILCCFSTFMHSLAARPLLCVCVNTMLCFFSFNIYKIYIVFHNYFWQSLYLCIQISLHFVYVCQHAYSCLALDHWQDSVTAGRWQYCLCYGASSVGWLILSLSNLHQLFWLSSLKLTKCHSGMVSICAISLRDLGVRSQFGNWLPWLIFHDFCLF